MYLKTARQIAVTPPAISRAISKISPWRAGETFLDRFVTRLRRFIARDHVNIDVAAIPHEPAHQIGLEKTEPRRPQRFAHYELRNIVLSRDAQQSLTNIPSWRRNDFRSELTRQSQGLE